MPESTYQLELRQATLDDAELVADLEALRDPAAPPDPVFVRHYWKMTDKLERSMRRIAVRDGEAIACAGASHESWKDGEKRYGMIRVLLRGDMWSDARYGHLVRLAEDWLRHERAEISVARVRKSFARDLAAIELLGYREIRQMRISLLGLVEHREKILGTRELC